VFALLLTSVESTPGAAEITALRARVRLVDAHLSAALSQTGYDTALSVIAAAREDPDSGDFMDVIQAIIEDMQGGSP